MYLKTQTLILFALFLILSCNNKNGKAINSIDKTKNTSETKELSKSQKIINRTIDAHGGGLFNSAYYSFTFRNHTYQFKNNGSDFEYIKTSKKGDSTIIDLLKNGTFSREINNEKIKLSSKEITSGTGAINSVIYFATLPHKLNDKAVKSKFIETTIIKGTSYDVIEITFNKDGGGEDFDDEFYYWINKSTKKIDYLAYNYKVNKGGVRFRSAYNSKVIDGITFQDYINYKAETNTPLKELPALYEAKKLIELSKIETENIINLKKLL